MDREGERFVAWLPSEDAIEKSVEDFIEEVRWVVRASTSLDDAWLEWHWETRAGWEALWEGELTERKVSERIVVAPAGESPTKAGKAAREAAVTIRLRPGLAFGTAEHPTTRSCLVLLDGLLSAVETAPPPGSHVSGPAILDVGTGSGILAIAAALLGARHVLAIESDPHACVDARENIRENGVEGRVEVRQLLADAGVIARLGPFDGILANIEPDGLLPLVPGLARAMAPGAWIVLSGIPRIDRDRLLAATRSHGLAPAKVIEEEGWWSAILRKNEQQAASPTR